jgi:signal transduction histidine kinase
MAPAPSTASEQQQWARFEAVRGRIFDELQRSSARWRLTWLFPLLILVVGVLVTHGESALRAIVQCGAIGLMGLLSIALTHHNNVVLKGISLPLGVLSYFALLATTGGLSSPLLVMGAVIIAAAATHSGQPGWLRPTLSLMIVGGFVMLAALARTPVGLLIGALEPTQGGFSSREYVSIALFASVFATMGIYRMGCNVTCGYERAALELLERREELCNQGENRNRELEGMAARLAHEVKNPLAAIKGLSVHMARSATDPKAAERLAIVAAEADRLQSIVDGFLSFSRGLDDLKVAPTKPFQVARELAVLLEARTEEAGVRLEVAGDEGLELDADARKLRQALLNIVLNAIQASSRGGSVGIAVTRDCQGGRITVRDEGAGMTPDVLERIRKPYFTTKEGGTGLGVAVARGLVEQHGGRLEFKSAPGSGTTATITLPMKATPCSHLPNPVRSVKEFTEAVPDAQSPAVGARSY